MLVAEIKHLIVKDVRLELKQKYALNGILLYVVSTIFVCYLSFTHIIDAPTWNSLFWIIMLFASVNAVSKSFVQESQGRQLYYYTLSSPQAVILSKIIYNILLMGVLSLLSLIVFAALMGNFIRNMPLFVLSLLLGSFGFASVLTMISAISSRTNNNFALMAILSFPIMMPLLITLMKVSKQALESNSWDGNYQFILVLMLINLVVVTLAFLLFPYLWKD
ncbi:MAG: heme exporter protein CcmB [Bacteroidales bacterium]